MHAERLVGPTLGCRGFTPMTYGTRRWLDRDPTGPRPGYDFANADAPLHRRLERPPTELVAAYASQELRFATEGLGAAHDHLLREAWTCLTAVPDTARAVSALALSIHILKAAEPGYDVSHSDPALPCSVFVSLPVGEPHAALRAAESILHEAMHLLLTLVEAECPLVRPGAGSTYYSPWQLRERPLGGVLHGLYVFAAIDAYLVAYLETALPAETQTFARKRRREIAEEIEQVRQVVDCPDLTPFGRRFATGLLAAR